MSVFHSLCSNLRLFYTNLGVEMSYVGMKAWKGKLLLTKVELNRASQAFLSAWTMLNTLPMLRSSYKVIGFKQHYKFKEILKNSWKLKHFLSSFLKAEKNLERQGMREGEKESNYTNITDTYSGVKEKTCYTGFSHFYQFANNLW